MFSFLQLARSTGNVSGAAAVLVLLISVGTAGSIEESTADWNVNPQGRWIKGAPLWLAVSLRGKSYSDAGPEGRLGPIFTDCFELGIPAWEFELRRDGKVVLAKKGQNRPARYASGEYYYLMTKPGERARFLVRLPPLPDDVREGQYLLRLRMHDRPIGHPKLSRSNGLSPWIETHVAVINPSPEDRIALGAMELGGDDWFVRSVAPLDDGLTRETADAIWFDRLVRALAGGESADRARESAPAFFDAEMLSLRLEAISDGADRAGADDPTDLSRLLESAGLGWMVDRIEHGRGGIAAVARRCRDWELARRRQQELRRSRQDREPGR